jgi:hypothetical protein
MFLKIAGAMAASPYALSTGDWELERRPPDNEFNKMIRKPLVQCAAPVRKYKKYKMQEGEKKLKRG